MIRKLKTVPRLTMVFIMTLLISGSILTYFSINNISNFKELTQKKISEEQQEIVKHVLTTFEEKLEDNTRRFNGPVSAWSTDKSGAILNSFAIDSQGNFLWPFYIDTPPKNLINTKSPGYIQYYDQAQVAEFQEQNLSKARNNYQHSLRQSSSGRDSAQALNSLARVFVKLKQEQNAYESYSDIISKHYSSLNKAGFPIAYFAILQLLNLDIAEKDSLIFREVSSFLSMIETGNTPLNQSSPEVLMQIEAWIANAILLNERQKTGLRKSIQKINTMMDFIFDYSDIIRESLRAGSNPDLPEIDRRFDAFRGKKADNSDLILLNSTSDTAFGFIQFLDSIWQKIDIGPALPETEFVYVLELQDTEFSNQFSDNKLTTIQGFSDLFPFHLVQVKLKNENIVDQYILRRSWIYGLALILLLGGMLLGITLILSDIRRENKLALLRSDFVSNVTHELKTPLTSISMFAESIYMGGDLSESDQKKYSNVIIKESGNLKRMINNILSFSMREDGKQSYQMKETDLSVLITSTIEELNYWLEKHKFKLSIDIEHNVVVLADPVALKQALSNLINNAIKYSPVLKNLSVSLSKKDKKVSIEIEDTGIGIPQDQIKHIFDKFYRVRSKDMELTSGTGIGLTVTKDIIDAHGGTIQVSSVLNQGSTFIITLNL